MKSFRAELILISCAIVAGGVFSFGFSALLLPLLLCVYLLIIASQPKSSSLFQAIKLTFVFFFVFYAVTLIWFLQTDIELLAGLDNGNAPFILGLCLLIMASVLTLVSLPFGFILHSQRTKLLRPAAVPAVTIASAWVVTEWVRSWVFSIFLWAPGASMGDYWNFGSLGLGAISSPLAPFSQYVGLYGLSMIVVLLSVFTVWAVKKRPGNLIISLTLISLLLLYIHIAGIDQSQQPDLKASVQQRENALGESVETSTGFKYLDKDPKNLIVLTEYSNLYSPGSEKNVDKFITNRLHDNGVSIDVSADFTLKGVRFNTLTARDKSGKVVGAQTKQLLIPTGEYLPMVVQMFYTLTGQDSINQNFKLTRQLYRGQPPRVINTDKTVVAPVACSGILGRNIYRQLVNDGGEVLTNSASLLIFSGSESYFRQSLQMARFHAVANQRTYIQASMGAPAFVINESGEFIIQPEDTQSAFIDFSFTPRQQKTLYTKLGEWPLVVAGLVLCVFAIRSATSYTQNRRKR